MMLIDTTLGAALSGIVMRGSALFGFAAVVRRHPTIGICGAFGRDLTV